MNPAMSLGNYAGQAAVLLSRSVLADTDAGTARRLASAIGVEAESTIRALLGEDRPDANSCPVCRRPM